MKLINSIIVAGLSLVTVVAFQNCGQPAKAVFTSSSPSKASDDSGQSYDGKLYVLIGEVCADGTKIRSKIQLSTVSSGNLVRQDCSDIAPIALSSSDFQVDLSNPDQLNYKNQIFVAAIPNAVGAGFGVLPKLNNPVDPTAYGAVGDGVTDNTAAFLAALNAGDMLIPAGVYRVDGTIRVPAGRSIQCASLSSVKIVNPLTTTQANNGTFRFWSQGGSISNCRMVGADVFNANGSAVFNVNYQYNSLVSIVDFWGANSNTKVINNIFENCHGNACVSIYGGSVLGTIGISNVSVLYNTFRNCGLHSVVIDTSANALVANNHITDCSMIVQNDNINQPNLNNVIEYNFFTAIHGIGNGSYPYLTAGNGSLAVDYSSNVVRNNTLVGNGTSGSFNVYTSAPMPAQYSNNSCTQGCLIK